MTEPEMLVGGIDFGEGLRWHDGRLWYSDFFQRAVFAVTTAGERELILKVDDQPSGLGWLPDGRLLVVSMFDRAVLRREPDGSLVRHADLSTVASGPCNDMVVTADGTAFVGNFGFDMYAGDPFARADLACITPDGVVSVVATGLAFPNGSVVTADGSTLIVGESIARRYTAYRIATDGTLHDRRVWAKLGDAMPDGCSLDAENAIWFADYEGGTVMRVREGGEVTHRVEIGQAAYACALGGDDGRTLFVASADGMMAEEVAGTGTGAIRTLRVDVPHAGLP